MSIEAALSFAFVVLLLCVLARVFTGPFRAAARFLLQLCLGVVLLYLANAVGSLFGAGLAYNPYTVLVAGLLNLPGIILLFFLRYWLPF